MIAIILQAAAHSLVFLALGLLFVACYRLILNRLEFVAGEYINDRSPAPMLLRSGRYVGLLIALSGTLVGSTASFRDQAVHFVSYGLLALVLFIGFVYLLDVVVLRGINNILQATNGNLAVAIVETCACVAFGLVLAASLSGDGPSILLGIASGAVFGLLGMAVILGVVYAGYEVITRWHLDTEITRGNVAAAVEVGSLMLAVAIVQAFSITGDFTGWVSDLTSYAIATTIGTAVILLARGLIDLVLLKDVSLLGQSTHHKNLSASVLVGLTSVGVAVLVGVSL